MENKEPTQLFKQLKKIIKKNFPELLFYTEACLSVIATLRLNNLNNPVGLNLVGPPSSGKTTVLSFFYNIEGITLKCDNFTPRSFVSHHANKTEQELKKNDLSPKIKDKGIIIPELAPLFGKRKDDLNEGLSVLTRIFDGEGLETYTGARGYRGYKGEYLFSWLGATTPLPNHVWKLMGKLGNRLLFLNVEEGDKSEKELIRIMGKNDFKIKVSECRTIIHEFLNILWKTEKITWNGAKDSKKYRVFIARFVDLIRRLRSPVEFYQGNYIGIPIIEKPERLMDTLYSIAKGHAIINGRNKINKDDLKIVLKVGLSTMPYDRSKIFDLLVKYNGELNTKNIIKELDCAPSTANRVIQILGILKIGDVKSRQKDKPGKPMKFIKLKDKYKWLVEFSK